MSKKKKAWSSPYKTRLWLSNVDHSLFSDRQKRMWAYFAYQGRDGSDAWNYKLARKFHVSTRTIRRDISHLKKHCLIQIIPGWSKLAGGAFVEQLRYRRIIALPWPTRRIWMIESIKYNLREVARARVPIHSLKVDKNVRLQLSLNKIKIMQTREPPAGPAMADLSRGSASSTASPSGLTGSPRLRSSQAEIPEPKTITPGKPDPALDPFGKLLYKLHFNELIEKGYRCHEATALANKIALDQRNKNLDRKTDRT